MYMLENTRKFSMHLIFDVDYEYCRIYEQENSSCTRLFFFFRMSNFNTRALHNNGIPKFLLISTIESLRFSLFLSYFAHA